MNFVLITGDGGSGGLIGYIKGILSGTSSNENNVILFCGSELFLKLSDIKTTVKIFVTDLTKEKGIDIVLNRPLPDYLIQLVEKENPDAILFMNGHIRKGLEKYPNIMVLHNQLYVDTLQLLRFGFNVLTLKLLSFCFAVRRSMKKADGVIFLSNFSKEQTDKKMVKYKNGKVIPFGFEPENRINKICMKKKNDNTRILYISALFPYKNHINLLKACNLLKNDGHLFKLSLIGQKKDPVYKKLHKTIKELKVENDVIYQDWVEHDKIKEIIDNSDIFIYPSSTETTGYGLLEGMARGALIACSDKAGFPEMLKDGGVYFDPQNIDSIRNAILKLTYMDENSKIELKQKALEYSYDYSWEKSAKEHFKYIKNVVEKISEKQI